VWCQLFSEPGAGSDVASLATRAVKDGDEWVVNGQKVWTTLAHRARWGLLVARTDPSLEKHKGLTYFVLDMEAPGVDVRPLRQMTGEAEFNEIYMTDVRVADSERLGQVGEGWRVALTTLMNERVSIGGGIVPRNGGPIGHALQLWAGRTDKDPVLRDKLLQLWVEAEVSRLTNLRAAEGRQKGTPGPEGSTAKLVHAELNKKIYSLCIDLMGAEGMLYGSYAMIRPDTAAQADTIPKAFLRARANSIEGGTSEIMRNILAERVLGLPGDIRVDRDRPWSEVPRS
jgi:alkylation response protein AidB-like acyl-CoA dehydrogenase